MPRSATSVEKLSLLVECDAHEGPTYLVDEDALYVTTVPRTGPAGVPRAQVRRIALDGDRTGLEPDRVTAVSTGTVMPNGMTGDGAGGLLICEQGDREHAARIARFDRGSGETRTLVDAWRGRPLNSPNDAVVAGDGAVWFTDPSYGYLQGFRPRPRLPDAIYRLDSVSGELARLSTGFDKPNGLTLSPDETHLYVTDSGSGRVYALDLVGGRRLGLPRVLDVPPAGAPDGITVDADGRVYVANADGVRVLSADGRLLHHLPVTGAINLTFGGREHNLLFITADTAVWVAVLDTKGA
jgi:gluconolactonase